jgi:hypothetical protein
MKVLALTLWVAAVVWLVVVLIGALQFQELYGGSSGLEVVLLGLAVGLIPTSLGWWAYRQAR